MELHRLVLTSLVVFVLCGALFLDGPSITGFVSSDVQSQVLNFDVSESERFSLSSDFVGNKLSSFALSGSVSGVGLVNVYLTDGSRRWLVFSNKHKPGSSMSSVTGLPFMDVRRGGKLDSIESLPDGFSTYSGAFHNECVESCMLDLVVSDKLFLDFVVEPGSVLTASSISFTVG